MSTIICPMCHEDIEYDYTFSIGDSMGQCLFLCPECYEIVEAHFNKDKENA